MTNQELYQIIGAIKPEDSLILCFISAIWLSLSLSLFLTMSISYFRLQSGDDPTVRFFPMSSRVSFEERDEESSEGLV